MTDLVTCRVCGVPSPLGTLECPECGAPLPAKPDPVPETSPAEAPAPEPDLEPAKEPPKRRWLRITAAAVALCLIFGIAAALLRPQKEHAPGAYCQGGAFITPYGVWDLGEKNLTVWGMTADGQYWLLWDSGQAEKYLDSLYGSYYSAYSWTHSSAADEGDYYLFDGRALEPVEWLSPQLTFNGVAVYLEKGEDVQRLCRRDLKTGKTTTLDEAPSLAVNTVADDGTAVAYTKYPSDPVDPGEEGERFLWTAGKGARPFDCPGEPWTLSSGGKSCLYGVDGGWDCAVWREGETYDLPTKGMISRYNADLTLFLYRAYENESDLMPGWYYCALGQDPVLLDCPENGYLEWITPAGEQGHYYRASTPDTLRGRFCRVYDIVAGQQGNSLYYLDDDLNLTEVASQLTSSELCADPTGRQVLYLADGNLYLATADKDGTVAVSPLTDTGQVQELQGNWGEVKSFAVSDDLSHIYYLQRDGTALPPMYTLSHWHDGETTALDMEMNTAYGVAPQVDEDGGCYILYARDLYYTKGDAPPKLILEDTGYATLLEVGPERVPVLSGARWKDGANRSIHWLLDGDKEPVELPDWHPEEGTL